MRAWNSATDDLTLKDGSVVKEYTIRFVTTEREVYKRIEKFFQSLIDEKDEPQTMLNDGTLVIKVEDATKVGRVLVGDDKNRGDLYYPDDEDEPQTDCAWGKDE